MSQLIGKLVYGSMLLTMIIHNPKLRLCNTDSVKESIALSSLLTLLALAPLHKLGPATKRSKIIFIVFVMPWVVLCCLRFVKHALALLDIIGSANGRNSSDCFVKALFIYCTVFGFAIELVLHWYALFNLQGHSHTIQYI